MRHLRSAGLAVLALAVSASAALAQNKGQLEIGTDFVGLNSNSVDGGSGSTTTISVNSSSNVRVGKMITDKVSVEPHLSFHRNSASGFSSQSTGIGVSALVHLKKAADKPSIYVRPSVAMRMSKFTSGVSTTTSNRTNLGVAVGMKKKLKSILIIRAEGYYLMTPKKDTSPAQTDLGARGGVSIVP